MPELADLRSVIEEELAISRPGTLGVKAWALPPWYYRLLRRDSTRLCVGIDFVAPSITYPRMLRVGFVQGRELGRSGVKWTLGKGLLGRATFGTPDKVYALIHDRDFDRGIEDRSFWQYRHLDDETRQHMKKRDFRKLSEIYGSAAAVPMCFQSDAPPIGCITVHSPKGSPLSDEQLALSGEYAAASSTVCARILVERVGYLS